MQTQNPMLTIHPIGIIHSCFNDKFGTPRQPGMVQTAQATLELYPPFDCPDAVRGLELFSHIWVLFIFHQHLNTKWKATVRPPRLGGNRRMGVFASRSPFRPNPIGLSAVRLEFIDTSSGRSKLVLSGIDIIDHTPVIDVKPYLPFADRIEDALDHLSDQFPQSLIPVNFMPEALTAVEKEQKGFPKLKDLIESVLQQDPRPAYFAGNSSKTEFGIRLHQFEIKWVYLENEIWVMSVHTIEPEKIHLRDK